MKDFIVYDVTGKILRTGSCPKNCLDAQITNKDEFIIEGVANDKSMYVKDGVVKDKSKDEIENELIQHRLESVNLIIQAIKKDMTDTEIDNTLNELFFNKIDIIAWKKSNYSSLRRKFYPDILDYVDAQVKMQNDSLKIEGKSQIQKYYNNCIEVKSRFCK